MEMIKRLLCDNIFKGCLKPPAGRRMSPESVS
jgi:hypothetical protein